MGHNRGTGRISLTTGNVGRFGTKIPPKELLKIGPVNRKLRRAKAKAERIKT